MSIFFSSDLHFLHKGILSFNNRPYEDIHEMQKGIINDLNETVGSGKLYDLGDFCFGGLNAMREIVSQLEFEIVSLQGNHDSGRKFKRLDEEFSHYRFTGSSYHKLKIDDETVVLCHFPILCWDKQHHGSIHLHGHCHGGLESVNGGEFGKMMDVGYDNLIKIGLDKPCIEWEDVRGIMDSRETIVYDAHKVR